MHLMASAPITADELRHEVSTVLARHGWTLEDFLAADVDDFDDVELRELWLLTQGALHAV